MDTLLAMSVFRRVVESGSFSAVASETNLTQPTVSKHVAALEQKLGSKLLKRSSRQLRLTESGKEYYQRCVQILDAISEAEAHVRHEQTQITGTLRLSTPIAYGRLQVIPHMRKFLAQHPGLKLDLILDDRTIDLVKEGVDLAVRMGPLSESSLIATKIGDCPRIAVASPDYLADHGEPKTLSDLEAHDCLVFALHPAGNVWTFNGKEGIEKIQVSGRFSANNPDAIREAVLSGLGIAIIPLWMVADYIDRGYLKAVLKDYKPMPMAVHAVYPERKLVPQKVKRLIEHLRSHFGVYKQPRLLSRHN